jgi:hypothetical protein
MVLDHIGIAVRSIERSIEHCHAVFGYEQMTEIVVNTRQKVRVVFLARRGSLPVKLIEPTDPTSLDLRVRSARRGPARPVFPMRVGGRRGRSSRGVGPAGHRPPAARGSVRGREDRLRLRRRWPEHRADRHREARRIVAARPGIGIGAGADCAGGCELADGRMALQASSRTAAVVQVRRYQWAPKRARLGQGAGSPMVMCGRASRATSETPAAARIRETR